MSDVQFWPILGFIKKHESLRTVRKTYESTGYFWMGPIFRLPTWTAEQFLTGELHLLAFAIMTRKESTLSSRSQLWNINLIGNVSSGN